MVSGVFKIAKREFEAAVFGMIVVADREGDVDGSPARSGAVCTRSAMCHPSASKVILDRKSIFGSPVLTSQECFARSATAALLATPDRGAVGMTSRSRQIAAA